MRGGEENETLVVFDSLPLYEPFHLRLLQSPMSVLDPRVVDGLDVHVGGFSAEFGDRMSTVVETRSIQPEARSPLRARHQPVSYQRPRHAPLRRRARRLAGCGAPQQPRRNRRPGRLRPDRTELRRWLCTRGLPLRRRHAAHAACVGCRPTASRSTDSDEIEFARADYHNAYVWGTVEHAWSSQFGGSCCFRTRTCRPIGAARSTTRASGSA